jgi:hypothetical protein
MLVASQLSTLSGVTGDLNLNLTIS